MDAKKTGAFIAELRKEQDLNQKQLAERLLVSDKAVSRWETGHGMPNLDNLEALAGAFDVSVAELLRGERIECAVEPAEAEELSMDTFALVKELLRKRAVGNIALGFLVGFAVVVLLVVHLTAPIALPYQDGVLSVDELSDGTLVATSGQEAAGIEVSSIDGEVFVNLYDTRLRQLNREQNELAAILGQQEQVDSVLYYPGTPDDVLIYGDEIDGGVVTLPRLVYNMWLAIGVAASIVGLIAYALLRKRWYARRVLRVALVPICFTVSLIAVLWGHFGEIYSAQFYLSGIVLLAMALYAIATVILARITP